jgi:hypothetical protein
MDAFRDSGILVPLAKDLHAFQESALGGRGQLCNETDPRILHNCST